MPRGLFLQGMVVLYRELPSVEQITEALRPFGEVRRRPAEGAKNWISGYEGWVLPFRPDVNGHVLVELIDAPWPDHMGDPKGGKPDQFLFGAWSMGVMTPGAWPGMLNIASLTAKGLNDTAAFQVAQPGGHAGFARVLLSYALGAADDAPAWPDGRDARAEFEYCLRVVDALLSVPGAAAYFNPAGSLLMSTDRYRHMKDDLPDTVPPVPLACMPRKFQANENSPEAMFELTGVSQLREDVPDLAAVFAPPLNGGEIVSMLFDTSAYLLSAGPVIEDGHTIDGPGGRWRATLVKESETPPPREVLVFKRDTGKRGLFSRLFGW